MMRTFFGDSLFDDWMDFPRERDFARRQAPEHMISVMRTDVKENDSGYELDIDLPGFKKEDVKAKLSNGYLTISATNTVNNDQQGDDGKYIRRERFSGNVSRSFYVGTAVQQEDIRARFEDGILKLQIPKKDARAVQENPYIAIEG